MNRARGGVRSEALSGVAFMMFGVACFAGMDASGKWLVRDFSIFQVLALRSTLAVVLLVAAAPLTVGLGLVRTRQPGAHLVRALCGFAAFLFFFASVRFLPLADAVAVAFGGPFIVTALSVPLLGETVTRGQWIAIAVGFVGMVLIVQPTGEGFRPEALLVVGSSVAYALMMILTRWMVNRSRGAEKTSTFLFYTFAIQAAAGWVFALPRFRTMSLFDAGLTVAVGVLALGGHFGVTVAFQRAAVSVVAPFEYTALVWATLFGLVVFGDLPQAGVWLGVAIIVASGLYTIRRESSPGIEH